MHILLHSTDSGVSMKMPDSTEETEMKQSNSKMQVKENSEYVRLVTPNELRAHEAYTVSPTQQRKRSLWWIKVMIWSSLTIALLLVFVKYGVSFLVEKVLQFPYFLVINLS